jgi:hypothetical protein
LTEIALIGNALVDGRKQRRTLTLIRHAIFARNKSAGCQRKFVEPIVAAVANIADIGYLIEIIIVTLCVGRLSMCWTIWAAQARRVIIVRWITLELRACRALGVARSV